ncbi:MAG: hypothetical protein Q4F07_00715 [Bacteroidales bacterium]|nr:hypothetical protein [Bacteroidales bacterium]
MQRHSQTYTGPRTEPNGKLYMFAGIVVLVISLAFTYCQIPYGMGGSDEFYQISLARYPETAPMAFLSGWLAHFWGESFGYDIFSMRILATTLTDMGLITGALYFAFTTRRWTYAFFLTAICAFFMSFQLMAWHYFGWDMFSAFLVPLCLVATLTCMRRLTYARSVIAGICLGVAAAVRLPNAVAVILAAIAIVSVGCMRGQCRRGIICALIAGAAAVMTYIGAVIVVYESFGAFADAVQTGFIDGESHSPGRMVWSVFYSLCRNVSRWGTVLMAVATVWWINRMRPGHKVVYYLLCAGVAVLVFMISFMNMDGSSIHLGAMFSGMFILLAFYLFMRMRAVRNSHAMLGIGVVMAWSAITFVGSNTGMVKQLACALVPVLLAVGGTYFSRPVRAFLVVMCLALVPVCVIQSRNYGFFDAGIKGCTAQLEHHLLQGISTTPARAAYLEEVAHAVAVADSTGGVWISVGDDAGRFCADYLGGRRTPLRMNDWSEKLLSDNGYITETAEWLEHAGHSTVSVIVMTPETPGESPMEKVLEAKCGVVVSRTPHVAVYRFR